VQVVLSRDEALLWLNDRLGKIVYVSVELDRGDVGTIALEGEGILEHWSEPIDPRTLPMPRDDLAGWYRAGDTRVNLTELEQAKGDEDELVILLAEDEDELVILLAEGVRLRIIEQREFRLRINEHEESPR
jgi:hypothetical protein